MEIAYGILGQTTVRMHGILTEEWGSRQARNLLTTLLVEPGKRCSQERLLDWAWSEEAPPVNPKEALYKAITRLRQSLEETDTPPPIRALNGGYILDIAPDLVDFHCFTHEMRRARKFSGDGEHESACEVARAALALWRDVPLACLDTEQAQNWRRNVMAADWAPAHSFLAAELLAVGRPDEALRQLGQLPHPYAAEPTFVKLRASALYALGQSHEARSYVDAALKEYAENGNTDAAADLQMHDAHLRGRRSAVSPEPAPRAAPVPAVGAIRIGLPRNLRGFVGRADALRTLDLHLLSPEDNHAPAVVVSGPPGIGKTSLAAYWAHAVADRFPGGILCIDMQGFGPAPARKPAEVVDLALTALGYPIDHLISAAARAARLRSLLRQGKPLLLILDNVGSSEQVDEIVELAEPCTVLLTSRRSLHALARRHDIPTIRLGHLDEHDSFALLSKRMRGRADEEPDAAHALARLGDGLPLALTLLAQRAVCRPGVRLDTMLEELRDPEMLLSIGDDGDDVGLRTTFSASYQALDPTAQDVFRLFGHHPGPEIQADTVLSASSHSRAATRRALENLVAWHLVDQPGEPDRYRIPDIFHRYARSLLPDSDPQPLRRLLSHYLQTALRAHLTAHPYRGRPPMLPAEPGVVPLTFDSAAAATQWAVRERDNLSALISEAERLEQYDYAAYLPHLLTDSWERHGCLTTATQGLAVAVRAARAVHDVIAEASSLNDLGELHLILGDNEKARFYLSRALDIATEYDETVGILTVKINLARLHRRRGEHAEAIGLLRRCIDLARAAHDPVREGIAEQYLGDAFADLDQREQALPHYNRALHVRTVFGDTTGQIATHTALAALHTHEQRLELAHMHCRQALANLDGCDDLTATMKLGTVRARLALADGNAREALRLSRHAVVLARRAHTATGQARALETLGEILGSLRNPGAAIEAWTEAIAFFRGRGRDIKADRLQARLDEIAEVDVDGLIPGARKDSEDTVGMPYPPGARDDANSKG
ncbi:AfsR/SARP family transcriptional regulator [Amycolatopsis eburnea]|uniref:Tetratricopeptide repeat protein n=1 Tax=Amycolatopsis eburnea TaxID=2267691 RepID=A0A3R9F724_9PSEU|nr:tetratricopeptide repeat protein [Amycolatopsis eburnea]RSD13970.1 tetratricopeptide repeat protein [Amycolatopsis eburnea]